MLTEGIKAKWPNVKQTKSGRHFQFSHHLRIPILENTCHHSKSHSPPQSLGSAERAQGGDVMRRFPSTQRIVGTERL